MEIYNFSSLPFWGYFLYFITASIISFYIPGHIFIRKLRLSFFDNVVGSVIMGIVMWTLQGFIFGFLHIRFLTYAYLLVFLVLYITKCWKRSFKFEKFHIDSLIASIIIVGTCLQVLTILFTGIQTKEGLFYCCGNANDAMWHIALSNKIVYEFPPTEPGLSNQNVYNYHYLSNIVIGELVRIFHLPIIYTQNQYSLLFISLLLGGSALFFSQIVDFNRTTKSLLLFFLYFGGDLVFLFSSIFTGHINFSMSSLEDGTSFLVNPPRAYSIVIAFVAFALFNYGLKNKNKWAHIYAAILFGSLIGFKVYTGIFVLSGLSVLEIYFLLKKRFQLFSIYTIAFAISLLLYFPINRSAGGLYFTGLWIFENFASQKQLNLIKFEMARMIFQEHNNYIKVYLYEFFYILLYITSIFGSKLLFVFQSKKSLKSLSLEMHMLLFTGITVSMILGLFFQQSSGGSNTFNFLVSVFVFISIYTALACSYWIGKTHGLLRLVLIIFIIVLTIPRVMHATFLNIDHIIRRDGMIFRQDELDLYDFSRKHLAANSLVLVEHKVEFLGDKATPYISFMINQPMYLSGNEILGSHGINLEKKEKNALMILGAGSKRQIAVLLKNENVRYVFASSQTGYPNKRIKPLFKEIYNNNKMKILEVNLDVINDVINSNDVL